MTIRTNPSFTRCIWNRKKKLTLRDHLFWTQSINDCERDIIYIYEFNLISIMSGTYNTSNCVICSLQFVHKMKYSLFCFYSELVPLLMLIQIHAHMIFKTNVCKYIHLAKICCRSKDAGYASNVALIYDQTAYTICIKKRIIS